jgi:hypothetical protein
MVLVAQTLDFFISLLQFARQIFHLIHQIDKHLAQSFILYRVGIEVF